jgi:hypothetical protein
MTLLPVLLPEGFISKVAVNDKLAVGQIIAEKKNTPENLINVAFYFNVPYQDISKLLKKNLGDAVLEGDILAEKKGDLGKPSKKLISQFSGTITKIDKTNGDVGIRGSLEKEALETIISPVEGIVDFCNNEKIVIKTDKDAILAIDGLGEESEGELVFFEKLEETKLTSAVGGKIILSDKIDRISLFKAIGLDAIGIIIKNLEGADFIDLAGKKIKTPIMIVRDEDFRKLIKADKKQIYLGGKDKTIIVL